MNFTLQSAIHNDEILYKVIIALYKRKRDVNGFLISHYRTYNYFVCMQVAIDTIDKYRFLTVVKSTLRKVPIGFIMRLFLELF